jgi:hypothetical protein
LLPSDDPSVSVVQMQKQSEEYRHKAAECARKALACREPAIQRGFAEAARRWRHLAQRTEDENTPPLPIRIVAIR